jgi:4-amino-4-deoxy-L-arabinose transferase-like glycosyltransferase
MVSVALAPEKPLPSQPAPDAQEYADSARSLAKGEGFFTVIHEGTRQPPRYPPGYPLALAPFAATGTFPGNVQFGAKVYVIGYVAIVVLAAWLLAGSLAGALAAVLVWISPFAHDAAGLVMADAFVAALTVAVLPLLSPRRTPRGDQLAGGLVGLALLARLTAIVNLIAVLAASPRRAWKNILFFASVALLFLGLVQWAVFGSPLETGYDYWGVAKHTFSPEFALSQDVAKEGPFIFADKLNGSLIAPFACPCEIGGSQAALPNVLFYPLLLAGGFWVFAPPLVPLIGIAYALKKRREAIGRYALAVVASSLVIFTVYAFQGTRFMAGPASVLLVLSAVSLSELIRSRIFPFLKQQKST